LKRSLNILICPLEWGLGHTARMIPVAERFLSMGHNVIVGSGEQHLALFRAELPGISYLNFTGFKPGYSRYLPQYISLLLKTPLMLYHIISEHVRLRKIILIHKIDIVISDNRFGLWNRNITSVYVTHMPRIPFPKPLRFLEFFGILFHRAIIKKYSYCLIPDLPGELNLSGRLSHGIALSDNVRYIGILSRFAETNIPEMAIISPPLGGQGGKEEEFHNNIGGQKFRHNTVILSGPEPQREILKLKLVKLLENLETQTIILEGKPELKRRIERSGNIVFYDHLPADEMMELIRSSDYIITRSGYTTVMELISLNCTALLIPTPGQTEQEYLAEYLTEKGWFRSIAQRDLTNSVNPFLLRETPWLNSFTQNEASTWSAEIVKQSKILLTGVLEEILEKQHN